MEEPPRNSRRHGQALFVLGGWPHPDAQGIWHSSLFEDGRIGDRLRVEAAAVLYHANPQLIIITGGNEKLAHLPEVPACAAVMKRELIELGLPATDILGELESGNTYEQLQFIKTVFAQFPIMSLRILSNRYHLPRIGAFLASDPQLRDWCARGRIHLLTAEDVLMQDDFSRWHELIADAYSSPAMRAREEQEQQGVQAIRAGTYKR